LAIWVDRQDRVRNLGGGSNQARVRAHNERLVLSLVRRHEHLAKSEIARRSGLSAQTVSVIMRGLEKDGLLVRGQPQRGRVGQPSIPMSLKANGVFSFGLSLGRRSTELLLMDFVGGERARAREAFEYPTPSRILDFVRRSIGELSTNLTGVEKKRIAGIGVAMPFELWNWSEKVGGNPGDLEVWRGFDLAGELAKVTELAVFVQNDATAACGAELVFGRGAELTDFVYFYVGSFVGGGIVLDHSVYAGRTGNAGALGSMPTVRGNGGSPTQLINRASLFVLENMLRANGIDPSPMWKTGGDWSGFEPHLGVWIKGVAESLAMAVVSACSVIDFESVVIEGGFPASVGAQIIVATRREVEKLDRRGIQTPLIQQGMVGRGARAVGGASLPILARYLLDQSVLFMETGTNTRAVPGQTG
jgi:predicted NBD/HSP70 family sugar kinase/predicted DNA-binding transcriptional regulator